MLEHGAGDDLADALALEAEAPDETVDRGGEHVLVGGLGVRAIRAGEGDPVAADDHGLLHLTHRYTRWWNTAEAMPDLLSTPPAQALLKTLGAPTPAPLRRYSPDEPLLPGPALLGGPKGGRLLQPAETVIKAAGAKTLKRAPDGDEPFGALVFDATGIKTSEDLRAALRLLPPGHPPDRPGGPRARARHAAGRDRRRRARRSAQRALEGFERALAKEIGAKGATANLVYVEPGAEEAMASTLRFLPQRAVGVRRRARSSGSRRPTLTEPEDWSRPLAGQAIVVTGASRGIGEAIAETLARDGAHVICLDVPPQGEALTQVANRIGGSTLQLDITSEDAPRVLADHVRERHGSLDAIIHNAGVTRDRTLGRMDEAEWDVLLDINLSSTERIDQVLLDEDVLSPDGRIVGVSSISGIAGNRGQVNYATSKAGVIGRVEALSRQLRGTGADDQRGRAGLHRDADDRRDAVRPARGRQAHQLARRRAASRSTSPRPSRGSPRRRRAG